MGITVRQAALHRRKAARDRTIPFAGNETEPTAGSARKTEDFAARADARMDLAQALDALAEEHRQVIVMRELQGMTYDEMAAALNLPRGTIESRLFRARQALRRLLGEE